MQNTKTQIVKRKHAKKRGKKRTHGKSGDLLRLPPNPSNQIFRFIRTAAPQEIITSATATNGVLEFKLSALDNLADFTTLFDKYRIDAVEVSYEPETSVAVTGTAGLPTTSTLYTVIDYDDGSAITDEATFRDYGTVVITPVYQKQVRKITPRVAVKLFVTSITDGYGESLPGQWVDVASTSVPHYGVKWFLSPGTTPMKVKIFVKYYLSFMWIR